MEFTLKQLFDTFAGDIKVQVMIAGPDKVHSYEADQLEVWGWISEHDNDDALVIKMWSANNILCIHAQ